MGPAAILNILVKSTGTKAVSAELLTLQGAARRSAASMGAVGTAASQAVGKTDALGKSAARNSGALKGVAKSAGWVALGVAGIGAAATKAAADYESSMNTLRAVSSATGAEMRGLSRLAKQLGADVRLPGTSAKDAAEAMTEMVKAGLSVEDTMTGVRDVLVLSAAAGVGNARAAEIATNAMNAFGLKGKDVKMVTDQLANAANASSVEIADVADSFKMAAAVFDSFQGPVVNSKVAMKELVVAIALLGNAGIKGSDAGTSLKQALLQLTGPSMKSKDAMRALYLAAQGATTSQGTLTDVIRGGNKTRDEALKQIQKMNPELKKGGDIAYTASGKMRSLKDIVRLVALGTRDMTQEQKNAYVTQIFGSDAVRAITVLMKAQGEQWDVMGKKVGKAGAAQALATAKMKGLKGSFDALKSSLETLAINVGTYLLPALTAIVSAVAKFTGLIDPKVFLITATAIGGVAAAIWLVNVALAANPVVLVVTGLALLGAALVTAYQKIEGFRNVVDTVFATLKSLVPVVVSVASSVGGALATAFRAVITAFNAVVGAVRTAVQATITEIGKWKVAFTVIGVIVDIAKAAFGPLVDIVRTGLGPVVAVVRALMNQLVNVFRTAWNIVKAVFAGAFTALKGIVLGFGQVLHGVIQIIGGILKGDFGQIWEGVKDIFRGALGALLALIKGQLQAFSGAAKALGEGIKSAIINGIRGIGDLFLNLVNGAIRHVAGRFSGAVGLGKDIVTGIVGGMGDIGHAILGRLKDAADWLKDKVGGLFGWIGGAVSSATGDGIGKAARESLPKMGKPGSLMGANRALAPVAGIAAGFGLGVSSGLRSGATTSSGNTSYHSSGEALDIAGPPAGMLKFFRTMRSRFGPRLAELIYTPGGAGIKDGQSHTFSGKVAADHHDHVHVAMDLGRAGIGDGHGRALAGEFMGDGVGNNVRAAWQFLRSKGFTAMQAAGIIGSLQGESGASLSPTARNPSSGATGIAQWLGDRLTALRRRRNPESLNTQLQHLWSELQGPESRALQAVRGAGSINEVSDAWTRVFERPGAHEMNLGGRQANARNVFNALRNVGSGGASGGGGGGSQPSTGTRQATQRVSQFERRQASAALGVAEIQRRFSGDITDPSTFVTAPGVYDAKGASNAALALRKQQQAIGGRIKQLRKALGTRGHTAAARTRYQTELAQLLPQHAELGRQRSALRNPSPEILSGGAEPVTQEDILNMQVAQAGLTPDEADDAAARAAMLDYRQGKYLQAQQGGDPRVIAEAATALKTAMDENNQLQEEANRKREEEIAAMKAHTDALNGVQAEMKRQTDTAVQINQTDAFQMKKWIADTFSGQIVGYGVNRRALTPGGGVEVMF